MFCCHCCSVAKSYLTLCNPVDWSTPGFPVLHCLPEFVQVHVHWVGDAVSSSATPFSCLQSFLASGSFPVNWLFTSDAQSIGTSASASVLAVIIQSWFPLRLTGLISVQSKRLLRIISQSESINSSGPTLLYSLTLTSLYDYWKNHSFDYTNFCQQSDVFAF